MFRSLSLETSAPAQLIDKGNARDEKSVQRVCLSRGSNRDWRCAIVDELSCGVQVLNLDLIGRKTNPRDET